MEEIEFLANLDKIISFVDLQKIFETWINDGSIYQNKGLLQVAYVSLLSYPAIFLTKEGAYKELKAAKVCHDIWLKYDKDKIDAQINGGDEKLANATKVLVLPPYVYLLNKIDSYYMLHYLLIGMFKDLDDSELSQIDGDIYARTWIRLLEQGYRGEMNEASFISDCDHRTYSWQIIRKMKLNEKYIHELNEENLKPRLMNYLNAGGDGSSNNAGNGCIVTLLLSIGTLSSLLACFGLIMGG